MLKKSLKVYMDGKNFILHCTETGCCVDVPESTGKAVTLYPHEHGGDNQQWQLKCGKIITALDSNLCLGVRGKSLPGAEVVLVNKNTDELKWYLDGSCIRYGEYYLSSKDNRLVLDHPQQDYAGQKWDLRLPPPQPKPATSCHLSYGLITEEDIKSAWSLECTVNVRETFDHTYFSVVGWGPGGYSGIQQLDDGKRKAIFSMWNKDGNNVEKVKCGEGVIVSTFGGEGTGLKSMADFDWKVNEPVTFGIKGEKTGNDWVVSCSIKVEGQSDFFMASFRRSNVSPLNTGGFYSFIEDFNRMPCTNGHLVKRSAVFSNPKINGRPLEYANLTKVKSGSDAFACHKVSAECEGKYCVLLQTGGCDNTYNNGNSDNLRLKLF